MKRSFIKNPKSPKTNPKQKSKLQTADAGGFEHWYIAIWNLFDIWDFDIGIFGP